MAFCTCCGANVEAGARFCTSCGATQVAATAPVVPTPTGAAASPAVVRQTAEAPVQPSKSSNTVLKIVLVIIAVLAVFGIAVFGVIGYSAYKLKKSVSVSADGTTISTPMGEIKATTDAADNAAVLREMGIEAYPNAKWLQNSSVVKVGDAVIGGLEFETSDTPEQVMSFYRYRYPKATLTVQDSENQNLLVTSPSNNGLIGITARRESGKTVVNVGMMSGESGSE